MNRRLQSLRGDALPPWCAWIIIALIVFNLISSILS